MEYNSGRNRASDLKLQARLLHSVLLPINCVHNKMRDFKATVEKKLSISGNISEYKSLNQLISFEIGSGVFDVMEKILEIITFF